jgi:hypothetical protein
MINPFDDRMELLNEINRKGMGKRNLQGEVMNKFTG